VIGENSKGGRQGSVTRREFLRISGAGITAIAVLGVAGCGGGGGNGGASGGPINAQMAGASPQGYFRILGETINSVVRNEYSGSSIAYIPGSPAGSLAKAATGRSDLAVAITPVEERLADQGKPPFQQSLEGQYQSVMQVHEKQLLASVAIAQWAEQNDVKTWDDVAEKQVPTNIAINQEGNVQIVRVAESYFKQHGFGFQDIEDWGGGIEYVASGEGIELLRDRRVDVFFNTPGFIPSSDLEDVSRSVDLIWLSMDKEKVQAVADEWNLFTGTVTPEDHDFIAQKEPTIRWPSDMIVNPDMPEDDVYRIAKAVFENKDKIQDIHPAMKDFSAEQAVRSGDRVPLHPGAERYYKEAGVL
jgi:TRAP transporter TAXI family solute receptor